MYDNLIYRAIQGVIRTAIIIAYIYVIALQFACMAGAGDQLGSIICICSSTFSLASEYDDSWRFIQRGKTPCTDTQTWDCLNAKDPIIDLRLNLRISYESYWISLNISQIGIEIFQIFSKMER